MGTIVRVVSFLGYIAVMQTLIDSFGFFPVALALLLLQLYVTFLVFTGRAARIGKTLLALPALLIALLCAVNDSARNDQTPQETPFRSVSMSHELEQGVAPGDARQKQDCFLNTSNEGSSVAISLTGNNTQLPPVAPPPAALVPVTEANQSAGGVHSAEYTDNGTKEAVSPAGFRASVPNFSATEGINLDSESTTGTNESITGESTRSLMDRVSAARRKGIEETIPAVVHIQATVMKETTGGNRHPSVETGGGVITQTRRGEFFVITNNHVAGNAVSTNDVHIVLHDHRTLHPTQIISCPEFDIALLRLKEQNLIAAPMGDSDTVKRIDQVYAIGSPFGLEYSITSGIISATKRRALPLDNKKQFQNFLQTDAPINPGNSGGPLLNEYGQVIGIVTVIATKSGASEGVGLAIPINHVRQLATRLIRDGVYKRPYIGMDLDRQFDAEAKAAMGLRRGAIDGSTGELADQFIGTRVQSVRPGSPASEAGVQEGDIIIACNGQIVEDGEHFNHIIGLSTVDSIVTLDILRGKSYVKVSPKLTTASVQ